MMLDIDRLREALKHGPLPGPSAHESMRATPSGAVVPSFEHKLPPKPGAVLILLRMVENQMVFPLIKRAEYKGAHSSQVSLPGGKAEAEESAVTAALREAHEEIGAEPHAIEVLGTLTDFFVIPSNFIVTPVVGVYRSDKPFVPDQFEVARILTGNLADLLREDAIRTKEILAANRYNMRAPHFEIEGEVVWGATAMMLNEFRIICQQIINR